MVGGCMAGGVHSRGHVCGGGHAWQGGMHGGRACMVSDMCGRGHVWQGGMHGMHAPWQILWDMVNERVVHILLECILVGNRF